MQKDFITVTPDSGNGNATVTAVASENSEHESREAAISIEGASMKKSINITQKGIETILEVSPNILTFNSMGGSKEISITCNGDWTIENPFGSVILNQSSGHGNATVSVTVYPNMTAEEMVYTLNVSSNSITKTITINQQGANIIVGGTLEEYTKPQTKVNMIYTDSPVITLPSVGDYDTRLGQIFNINFVIRCDEKYRNVMEGVKFMQQYPGQAPKLIAFKTSKPGPNANFSGQWSRPSGISSRFTVTTTRQVSLGEIHVNIKIAPIQAEDEAVYYLGIVIEDPDSQNKISCVASFTLTVNN